MKNPLASMISTVLLIIGIYLIAYVASTPGDQFLASFTGGCCIGIAVPLIRDL